MTAANPTPSTIMMTTPSQPSIVRLYSCREGTGSNSSHAARVPAVLVKSFPNLFML